jgi:hypothetical protein
MSDLLDDVQADLELQVAECSRWAAKTDEERELARSEGWGLTLTGLGVRKLIAAAKALRDRVASLEQDRDAARTAIQDLRARVKKLEDAQPPPA